MEDQLEARSRCCFQESVDGKVGLRMGIDTEDMDMHSSSRAEGPGIAADKDILHGSGQVVARGFGLCALNREFWAGVAQLLACYESLSLR